MLRPVDKFATLLLRYLAGPLKTRPFINEMQKISLETPENDEKHAVLKGGIVNAKLGMQPTEAYSSKLIVGTLAVAKGLQYDINFKEDISRFILSSSEYINSTDWKELLKNQENSQIISKAFQSFMNKDINVVDMENILKGQPIVTDLSRPLDISQLIHDELNSTDIITPVSSEAEQKTINFTSMFLRHFHILSTFEIDPNTLAKFVDFNIQNKKHVHAIK